MTELPDIQIERPAAGKVVLVFTGEHDVAAKVQLDTLLGELGEENEVVVADMSEARFVDSSVVSSFIGAKEAASARGRVFRVQMGTEAIVRRVFEIAGVLEYLDCTSSREEALDE